MSAFKVIAVIAANPALSSVLTAVLAATSGLRVRQFDSRIALLTYMRLMPVDVLVCDFDNEDVPAGDLALAIADDTEVLEPHLQIIALSGTVTEDVRRTAIEVGIDEVIVKPMSPRYLVERVQARLKHLPIRAPLPAIPPAPARDDWPDNVVPLFRPEAQPGM